MNPDKWRFATTMRLTLFHTPSSRSLRPLWLLEEMGLDFELKTITYDAAYFASDEYRAINPMGKVPALYDGDNLILESTVILEYILAKHAPSSLSVKPEESDFGFYLTWLHMAESGLAHYLAVYLGQLSGLDRYAVSEGFEAYVKYQAEKAFEMLDNHLIGRSFIAADRFTAADISVGYSLFLASALCGLPLPDRVQGYFERLQERPAWKKAVSVK
ncbi:glutathione S-transferase family protein [Spongiibacter sp. KMU-166]|uniref:Glutathione S-transferase family protein n=1 Tax=Spongiibacter thalassae TaxID=2721624 RepID=A0ABX1GIC1_9GAMM|nr:glutathione S-transferase family protein [Spongiibacter thalassae]NKI18716.1 glutathione S-transferase family protein [Spongiibacter thalassae]